MNENIDDFSSLFIEKDWFHSTGMDEFNRPIVYVKKINKEVMDFIPDKINNKQIIVRFSAAKLALKSDYVSEFRSFNYDNLISFDITASIKDIKSLEDKYGLSNVMEVFYHIHDGLSEKGYAAKEYPELHSKLQSLYDELGFDILYEYIFIA